MDTHEQRIAAYELQVRAKYTQAEVDALGAKGHAFKNPDGHYSFPIDDVDDLRNAIHAVGRAGADHDAIRVYIVHRAGALSATDLIPDDWDKQTGAIKGASASPARLETRALREEMRGVREERRVSIAQFEIREVPNGVGGTNLKFEGYASVTCADEGDTEHAYEMEDWVGPYQEGVIRGAFAKTLTEGCDTAFLVNHGGVTMARTKPGTLRLHEDLVGLHVDATLNPSRSDVQILKAAVADGAVDEMSFAFRVNRQKWSYMEENGVIDRRWLQELNLDKGDVSPVNYGANPHTGGLVSMRSAMGALLTGRGLTLATFAEALCELRAGKTISASTAATLQPILDHLAAIDEMVDADQPKLANLLGVANPDEDDGGSEAKGAVVLPFVLPNHTERARVDLGRMRRAGR